MLFAWLYSFLFGFIAAITIGIVAFTSLLLLLLLLLIVIILVILVFITVSIFI